jgi:ribosomal protein S27AE
MSRRDTFAVSSTTTSRTISSEHCPTCDGTTFVTRSNDRVACPTCSPAGQRSGLHVPDRNHSRVRASHILRWAMLFAGVAILVGFIALWANGADAWRELLHI